MRLLSILVVMLFASCVSAADAPAMPPDGQSLDLFLLIGQSNMAGRGAVEPQDKVAHPRVWTFDKADHWVPAVDPLHFDKPTIAGVGLGSSFGRAVADRLPDRQVGLIPCAVGGTTIAQWKPGSALYNEAVRRAKLAQSHGKLRAILWHQGESDATAARVPVYMKKFEELISHLRADLREPELPVIVGQIGTFHVSKAPLTTDLNAILARVSQTVPRSVCASSEGLKDKGDATHFDSASQREFGRRYAAEYFRLIGLPPTTQSSVR